MSPLIKDTIIACALTLTLHVLIIIVTFSPPGNYFFPFIGGDAENGKATFAGRNPGTVSGIPERSDSEPSDNSSMAASSVSTVPYLWRSGAQRIITAPGNSDLSSVTWRRPESGTEPRSLFRRVPPVELQIPMFSGSTIVPKPETSLFDKMAAVDDSYLLTDVFAEAVAAEAGWGEAVGDLERHFIRELQADIADGRLDMPFSRYIIHAEFFQLSRALIIQGRKPAFTLDEALLAYHYRLQHVTNGLPDKLSGYSLIMLLQRYAENKYYPENGSGMLLDSLFHNLNDCEGGTKEILAYLNDFYPRLEIGSNRGMVQTSTGEFIGHMQVYLASDPTTKAIIENEYGVIVETTRVGLDSILPWQAGEVYPLEDFVFYYYPELIYGTPLEAMYSGGTGGGSKMDIVGTSNHPLKKSYSGTSALLSSHSYDLSSIRSRRIENEFLRSDVEVCDPHIDPMEVDSGNLFANFVAIDGKLRGDLVRHYLADMPYWDNQVMPQWKTISYLPDYDDLAVTLKEENTEGGFLEIDPLQAVAISRFEVHRKFLQYIDDRATEKNSYLGKGGLSCDSRTTLNHDLLRYLFLEPASPGVFFLPPPGAVSWSTLHEDLLNDCLALEDRPENLALVQEIEATAGGRNESFRAALQARIASRGDVRETTRAQIEQRREALEQLFRGGAGPAVGIFERRFSPVSELHSPGVMETISENGRTGINPGLLRDVVDFAGQDKFRQLVTAYVTRGDLQLTVHRAVGFVRAAEDVSSRTGGGSPLSDWLISLSEQDEVDEIVRLAILVELFLKAGDMPKLSAEAGRFLASMKGFRATHVADLREYGLTRADALSALQIRFDNALKGVFSLLETQRNMQLAELVEIKQSLVLLADQAGLGMFSSGLYGALLREFERGTVPNSGGTSDYGVLTSVLYLLATGEKIDDLSKAENFIRSFTLYGKNNHAARLMTGLVDEIFPEQIYLAALKRIIDGQFARILRLAEESGASQDAARETMTEILAEGNIVVRFLLALTETQQQSLAGDSAGPSENPSLRAGRWYLEKLHRRIAGVLVGSGGRNARTMAAVDSGALLAPADSWFDADFYNNRQVRESFSLLSFLQDGGDEPAVKFRKMRDLRSIKDPSSIKIVKADRRVTRQDMSLLTLALHPGNAPAEIRKSWEETLGVINGHMDYAPFSPEFRAYLFAPNWPYLIDNDHGFFYSPDAVEDLHNADSWGGRNDILLSSYLHFRNLPQKLPEWLLRTAIGRSEFEREVFDKFSRMSFLPMILECTDDYRELPEPLFQAKWITRKPFGEDIFPATLLLLRLGYMDISEAGALVVTDKGGGGA